MKKYIFALCLALCVALTGCGGNGDKDSDDSTAGRVTGVVNTTQAPDVESTPDITDTQTDAPDSDTAKVPVSDIEPSDTTSDMPDTDAPVVSDTPDTDKTEDTTGKADEPIVDEPTVVTDIFDISDTLAAGEFAQGQFVSRESKSLRLLVNYISGIDPTNGDIMIEMEVWLESYDIACGARIGTGKITIDGELTRYDTDSISHTEGTKAYTFFKSHTYRVPSGNTECSIDVSWLFNGTYGGQEIDTLNASAVLILAKR
jgi:hypothetical protein